MQKCYNSQQVSVMRFSIIAILLLVFSLPLNAESNEGVRLETGTLFLTALQTKQSGKLEAALPLFKLVAKEKGSLLADYAQFEIGETYFTSEQFSQAVPEYYKVTTNFPHSLLLPKASLMLGKSYLKLKNYARAIKTFRYLVKAFPESDQAAEARFLIGTAEEAQKDWRAAFLAYEETDLYHPLTSFGNAARLASKHLKKKHKNKVPHFKATAAALFKKGMAYYNQDDYPMAANIFNRLALDFPKSKYLGKAWLMLGRAEMQSNDYPSAISDLERASNYDGAARYYLGLAYGRRGNYDQAIAVMRQVLASHPDSGIADDAAYWLAYYYELKDDNATALTEYYNLIKNYPYSKSVVAAIWRMGHIYYWKMDFPHAIYYLHLAQLYPPTEDTPRCYFFEAKSLEHQGNSAAARAIYQELVKRFDHTYYAYRAQDKLNSLGLSAVNSTPFNSEDYNDVLSDINEGNQEELTAIMEIWEENNSEILNSASSLEARLHFDKYKELINLGLTNYAADEARFLVNITTDSEKESAQTKLGEMLVRSGEYRTPIRFADRKIKSAVIAGKTETLSKKLWELSYPKGYWRHINNNSSRFGLDPFLVLAVIREESRFNARATSRSYARGLMQIIPGTGRGIAADLKLSRYRTRRLYEPSLNIEMGTYYLSNLIKNFSNNFYLALAGYNGGPNKIKRYVKNWYGNINQVDIDEFVESIPSRETRLYVQKVMGSYFEYRRLYGRNNG